MVLVVIRVSFLGVPIWSTHFSLVRREKEVLLLYAGQTSDASPLLQHLLGLSGQGGVVDDLFHTNLIIAGHCLAAYPTVRQFSLRPEPRSERSQLREPSGLLLL